MPSKKRKKSRPPIIVNVASVYNEDVGCAGVKKKKLSILNDVPFDVPVDDDERRRRKERMERFVEHNPKKAPRRVDKMHCNATKIHKPREDEMLGQSLTTCGFVGRSTSLEKPYMRLTTAPKEEDVRPLYVLRKSLAHVKAHYIQNEDFDFANEQLKSIRQDITVQHLRNKFVLEVYETHARILLENGDLNEFNQCQTMIQSLTNYQHSDLGITKHTWKSESRKSKKARREKCDILRQSKEAADEFGAYTMIYNVVQKSWSDLKIHFGFINTRTSSSQRKEREPNRTISKWSSPTPAITHGSSMRHALNVVKAIINDDYVSFFRLYDSAPHMSAYLMDFLVRRVRDVAFSRMIAAYRPTISIESFREALSFRDLEETRQFLKKKGAIFLNDKQGDPPFWVDCKPTYAIHIQQRK